jgi:ribosomal subunit interface protein
MQTPLKITFHDVSLSDALEQHIREKAAKLEELYPRISGCQVTVELPHKHKTQGKLFNVRVGVRIPGSEIAVNHRQDEDVYIALRDAFDAARRGLEDHARMQRGDIKHHASQDRTGE